MDVGVLVGLAIVGVFVLVLDVFVVVLGVGVRMGDVTVVVLVGVRRGHGVLPSGYGSGRPTIPAENNVSTIPELMQKCGN